MGFWSRVKKIFGQGSWSAADDRWYAPMIGLETNAGSRVDQNSAMNIPAVWACIRIIAESIGSLPLHLYTRQGRGKNRAVNHPLYLLLHDRPNPEMTAMAFRETMAAHVLAWGNAYAEKELDQLGRVKALWPIGPDRVEPMRDMDTNEIFYKVRLENSGMTQDIPRDRMLHIPGLSYNGLVGYSPIAKMREAIGLALATEEFGARFFGAGTHPGLIVSHPGKLGEIAHKNLRESLATTYSGLGKAHRLLLLEEAMKVEKIGVNPEEAQFLTTRRFQLAEIARIYRVPMHMLADVEKGASYASIEQMSLDFVVHTLRPWLVRFEQSYNNQLFLTDLERKRYFWEHLVDGLLRGDIASRYEAYTKARNWGWLSADDIRELENMNPLPDGKGEIYLQPLNMVEAGVPPPPPAPALAPTPPEPTPPDQIPTADYWKAKSSEAEMIAPYRGIFTDAIEQILSREANQLKRNANLFDEPWKDNDIGEFIEKKITPSINLFIFNNNGKFNEEYARKEVNNYIQYHIRTVKSLINTTNKDQAIDELSNHAESMAEEIMLALLARIRSKDHASI
jgi:HK97 family phage portal protein